MLKPMVRFIKIYLSLSIGLLMGCALQAQNSQPVDFEDGIVGYFPFNGNAIDKSYQGSGALVNGAQLSTDRFGNPKAAYKFDGTNSALRIPAGDMLNFPTNTTFSISLWIKPRDINTGCIVFKNYDYGIKWNGLKKPLVIYTGPENGFIEAQYNRWSTNEWYNIVLVQKSNELSLFINGTLDQSFPYSHSLGAAGEDVFVGKHPYYWGAFEGEIDDICFFARPLNPIEIEALSQIAEMPIEIQVKQNVEEIASDQITGNWQGVFTQPGNKQIDNYAYWLDLEIENNVIKGHSRIEIANTEAFGIMRIRGTLTETALQLAEISVVREYNPSALDWCMKYVNFRYVPELDALQGKWFADNCKENGEIILFRTDAPFNFYRHPSGKNATIDELLKVYRSNQQTEAPQQETLVNTKIDIEPITFITGSFNLTPTSREYLRRELVPFLNEAVNVKVNISGHTDNVGPDQLNLQLSISRAKAVADFLQQNGISAERVSYEGFGKAKPIASNDTEAGRILNRRVEVEIVAE